MNRYVALVRGINVGGKNLIKMTDLKACFEKHGLLDVVTYIQSGNVLFSSSESAADKLATEIEGLLDATFRCKTVVVVRSGKQLGGVVARAPKGFGTQPAKFRYDVIFLKAPVKAASIIKDVPVAEGIDQAYAGTGVLYFSRLTAKATGSRLSKIVNLPAYKSMTIRNWNTTTALLRMVDSPSK